MKHKINLLIAILFYSSISFSQTQQLTISFENPIPNTPTGCNDIWSENGVEMEFTTSAQFCSAYYGNSKVNVGFGTSLLVDLSSFGLVESITFYVENDIGCSSNYGKTTYDFYLNGEIVTTTTSSAPYDGFWQYTFNNYNSLFFDELLISNYDCEGGQIDYMSFNYTLYEVCETEPISNVRNGDVYLDDACYGVIMTSPSGNCFRAKVADNGMLFTEPVECP